MTGSPFHQHLLSVIAIARAAGIAILRHYAEGAEARAKADGSPVTAADHEAEAIILAGLSKIAPDLPILSEEEAAAGRIPDLTGGTYWCVDPLDGTKEFVNRSGEFTVCIGGVVAGRALFGVLHAPALDLTYAGCVGEGAWRVREGQLPVPIHARVLPETGRVGLVSRSHRDGSRLDAFLDERGIDTRRPMGSAIKFGLIAEGRADLYARFGPTSEWDTAAGQAVLEAAGGRVTDLDGHPLGYGKQGFLNAGFIACGA